jgi:hypothetical protein
MTVLERSLERLHNFKNSFLLKFEGLGENVGQIKHFY